MALPDCISITQLIQKKLNMSSVETNLVISSSEQSGAIDDHFPLLSLPAEIRQMIYCYVLVFANPVYMKQRRIMSSYHKHLENCPWHYYSYYKSHGSNYSNCSFICISHFDSRSTKFNIPYSVLALLGVCRQIYREAAPVFYRGNHFTFPKSNSMNELANFLNGIGKRSCHLRELTFCFESRKATIVFSRLAKCLALEKLHIYMDIDSPAIKKGPLLYSRFSDIPAVKHMLKIRGLKVLELAGEDRTSDFELVDINHPGAIGPFLMQECWSQRRSPKSR